MTLSFRTLLRKETDRFLAVWTQTLLGPVINVGLYLVIFGVSLGSRIQPHQGVPYLQFLVPGMIMIGLITNSALNGSTSIFLAKLHGTIFDLLVAPISYLEMTLAYILACVARGLIVGVIVYAVGFYFSGLVPLHPGFVLLSATLTAWCFGALGTIIGVWAKDFDRLNFFSIFVINPLVFLGGSFYSVSMLPAFWQSVARLNPLLYMVDSLRYGFLGISDVNPWISIAILSALTLFFTAVLLWIFKTGWRLRS